MLIQKTNEFHEELGSHLGHDDEIRMIKTAIFQANEALQREKDRREREVASAQQQVESLTSRLATVEQN